MTDEIVHIAYITRETLARVVKRSDSERAALRRVERMRDNRALAREALRATRER